VRKTGLVADRLATIPGATTSGTSRGGDSTIHWYSDTAGSGTIRLHGDGTKATIELHSAPTELASRIAETVAALSRNHPGT